MTMGLAVPELGPALAAATEDAAAAMMRDAGNRLHPPAADVDTVLAALFAEVTS